MIRVTLGTSTERKAVMAQPTDTLRQTLESNKVAIAKSTINLDGALVQASELNKPFTAFGIEDGGECQLIAVIKADAAR